MGRVGIATDARVHTCGLANRAAVPDAFLPHPKKDPRRGCFIMVLCSVFVGACFGWLGVRHSCPQWDPLSPSGFPASLARNPPPPWLLSKVSVLMFP